MKKHFISINENIYEELPLDILFYLSKFLKVDEYNVLRQTNKYFYGLPAVEKKVVFINCPIFEVLPPDHCPQYTKTSIFDTYKDAHIFQASQLINMYTDVVMRDENWWYNQDIEDTMPLSVQNFIINKTDINIWFPGHPVLGTTTSPTRWEIYENKLIRTPRMEHSPSPEDGMIVAIKGRDNIFKYISMHDHNVGWFTEKTINLCCPACIEHWVQELYVKFENEDDSKIYDLYYNWTRNELQTIFNDPYKIMSNIKFVKYKSFGYRTSRVGISGIVLNMPIYHNFISSYKYKHISH